MKDSPKTKATKIAALIVALTILNQGDDNYYCYFNEIEEHFPELKGTGWREDESYLNEIADCLYTYPQFAGCAETVEIEEDSFNCCAWVDYTCSDWEPEE